MKQDLRSALGRGGGNRVAPVNSGFDKPSRGTSEVRGEQESAETSSFRCDCERCRLPRGAVNNNRHPELVSGSHGLGSASYVPSKKAAFTLAEVLITLGIIGVVAAMTIPSLIANYQKKVLANQLKKSVSTLQNGFKMIIANEGVTDLSDTSFGQILTNNSLSQDDLYDRLQPEFRKVFNIAKSYSKKEYSAMHSKTGNITDSTYCNQNIGKIYTISYKVSNRSQCVADPSGMIFVLSDGSYFDFERSIIKPVDDSKESKTFVAEIELDINGFKGPNQFGYDFFDLLLASDGSVLPAGGMVYAITRGGKDNYKKYYWSSGVGYTCKVKGKNYSGYGSGCAASVMENGWEIDYD